MLCEQRRDRARGASPPIPYDTTKTSARALPAHDKNTPHTQGQRGSSAPAVGKRTLVLGGVGKLCVAERARTVGGDKNKNSAPG